MSILDWREVSVDDLAAPIPNALATGPFGSAISSKFFRSSGIPVIRGGNLSTDSEVRLIDEGLAFLDPAKAAEFTRSVVRRGDLIFTSWGTINQIGLIDDSAAHDHYVISNKQMKFTPDPSKASTEFLYYLFSTPAMQRVILNGVVGTGVPGFNLTRLRSLRFLVPPLGEQQEIADAIGEADSLVSELKSLIAKKRDVKEGIMQEILAGRTRLPGFTGEWRKEKLGSFASVKAGGTPSTAVSRYWGGNIRWMSSGEVHQKQINEVEGRITLEGLRESSAQLFPVDTVVLALAGQGKTRGTAAIARVELTTNQSLAGVFPASEYDSNYLYYNLDSRYDELRGASTGDGGRGGLNLKIIKNLEVPLPPVDEQRAIGQLLLDADAEIEALERRLESARAVKVGMMQELLTGRTRLPVEEEV